MMPLIKCGRIYLIIFFISSAISLGAQNVYQPARVEMLRSYKHASDLDALAKNCIFKTYVKANWQAGGSSFWYKNRLVDGKCEYWWVNATTGEKKKAFDHNKVAAVLSNLMDTVVAADNLPVENMQYDERHHHIYLKARNKWYDVNLINYRCTLTGPLMILPDNSVVSNNFRSRWERQMPSDSLSPDKNWMAYTKDGNVFVQSTNGGQAFQYTTDGDTSMLYGQIQWSPDSKYLVVFHIRPVREKPVYYILSSLDSTTRGVLKSNPYAQPGDAFTSYEMFTIDLIAKKIIKTSTELYDFLDYPWINWRVNDNRYFVFEKADRGHQRYRIIEVDASNGATRNLIDEKTNTFIYESRIFTWYTARTNEIIWTSETDGWNHIYLVDALKGGIKTQVTKGNWVVRSVDSIDEKKREVWFSASGMNPGEDPYNIHYYRIGLDGKNLVSLTPANASHQINFSPDRQFFIDNYSRPDLEPVSDLCITGSGKLVRNLEHADLSIYRQLGIRKPEVFVAKGRDGIIDIWGIVCRPRQYDSTKKYPVIENIYAGPQDSFVPKQFMNYGEMQSLAELGFIVVQCDGMGTANRSKAFHDIAWKNLADAGLPDRILWIKALAKKY